MRLRRFEQSGLAEFERYLDRCTVERVTVLPDGLLEDDTLTSIVEPAVDIEIRQFKSRFDLAESLFTAFQGAGLRPSMGDKGLWAWLACAYFSILCSAKAGSFTPGARPRWIPLTGDWKRYYRHLVAGPFGIYRAHRENPRVAIGVLCQAPGRPGDVVEQLASRQELVSSAAIMGTASRLFFDDVAQKQKRGAGGKGAGSARRFVSVLNQFDLTLDVAAMSADELLSKLPAEFVGEAN